MATVQGQEGDEVEDKEHEVHLGDEGDQGGGFVTQEDTVVGRDFSGDAAYTDNGNRAVNVSFAVGDQGLGYPVDPDGEFDEGGPDPVEGFSDAGDDVCNGSGGEFTAGADADEADFYSLVAAVGVFGVGAGEVVVDGANGEDGGDGKVLALAVPGNGEGDGVVSLGADELGELVPAGDAFSGEVGDGISGLESCLGGGGWGVFGAAVGRGGGAGVGGGDFLDAGRDGLDCGGWLVGAEAGDENGGADDADEEVHEGAAQHDGDAFADGELVEEAVFVAGEDAVSICGAGVVGELLEGAGSACPAFGGAGGGRVHANHGDVAAEGEGFEAVFGFSFADGEEGFAEADHVLGDADSEEFGGEEVAEFVEGDGGGDGERHDEYAGDEQDDVHVFPLG